MSLVLARVEGAGTAPVRAQGLQAKSLGEKGLRFPPRSQTGLGRRQGNPCLSAKLRGQKQDAQDCPPHGQDLPS